MEHTFLNAPLMEHTVNVNLPVLTNPVCPVDRLAVDMWIPILLKEYNMIGCREIDPKTPCPSSNQIDEMIFIITVEIAHVKLSQNA